MQTRERVIKKIKIVSGIWFGGFGDAVILFPFFVDLFFPNMTYKDFLHQAFGAPLWIQDYYILIAIFVFALTILGMFSDKGELDNAYSQNE